MDSWNLRLDDLMPVIRERLEAGETVEFMPRGVSMLPLLRQGRDAVVLSPLPERLRKYDVVLYRRRNGQYVLHRIVECGRRTPVWVTTSSPGSRGCGGSR